MVRLLLWFGSHSKLEQKQLPFKAQGSKPDQYLPWHFIAWEALSQLCSIYYQPGLLQHPAYPEEGQVEEMNFPSSIRTRERAAA